MFFSPSKHREEKSVTEKNSSSFRSIEEKKPPTPRERETATTPRSSTDAAEAMTPGSDKQKDKEKDEKEGEKEEEPEELDFDTSLHRFCEEINRFLDEISDAKKKQEEEWGPPEIPECFEKFIKIVEDEIAKYDCGKDPGKWSREMGEEAPLLKAIDKVSKLTDSLGSFTSQPKSSSSLDRISSLQLRAMLFLEDEFRSILEDSRTTDQESSDQKPTTKQLSFKSKEEPDRCVLVEPDSASSSGGEAAVYPSEAISKLNRIASTMISAGYATECCQVYSILRRTAFEESLSKIGFEKISIDDIQKMSWESLEGEIATWIKVCKKCISVSFSNERNLSNSVFSTSHAISDSLSCNLIRGIVIQLLNFAQAVAMTKRSAEKLFKYLDIYEALRDMGPTLDDIFPGDSSPELKSETALAKSRIGEAAVTIFSDLENSIKSDNGKTPVPGGAVHPLTRYVMNYLKYACEYHETLEQVLQQHKKIEKPDTSPESDVEESRTYSPATKHQNVHNQTEDPSPFSVQLMAVMDLLDTNLEAKSKLYKDLSLSYIFLMNNGRYIMKKIKGSQEIYGLMGDTWCRKRSSDLRNYHKSYTRETWGKVLNCFKEEGLHQSKGNISKPQLKERFKSFNAIFEEIHKTQSSWVVSDGQLQSELRVSISAVIVPAYRSFLARYRQHLDPGRQMEKYIKFGPEELETFIDELFDGTPASMVRRRT